MDASLFAFPHTTKPVAIQAQFASDTIDTGASCTYPTPLWFLPCSDVKRALHVHACTQLNLLYSLPIGVIVSVANEDGGGLMALAASVI